MKKKVLLASLVAVHTAAPALFAENQDDLNQRLLRRIEELERRIAVNEQDTQTISDASKAKRTAVSLGAGGLAVTSADSNFVMRVRGYVQADSRLFIDDKSPLNDSFLLRRVRPIIEGTVFEKYDYRLMLDFGQNVSSSAANNAFVQDAYVTARWIPEFQLQAGKFKEPVGLERLQSGSNLLFPERAYPTQLLPNRDVGIMAQGSFWEDSLSYAAGVFNGVKDGGSGDYDAADDDKDFAGRIFTHPFKKTGIIALHGFGIGVAGTYGNQEGALRNYASPGQQRIFAYNAAAVADGTHWRLSPQGYYYFGPFGIFGEYAVSQQEIRTGATLREVENTAWQVAASYFLTGETNSFKAVTPAANFKPSDGGWGAFELAARVSGIDFEDSVFPLLSSSTTSVTDALTFGVGLNWHLNRNVKVSLAYEHTDFNGATATPAIRDNEDVVFSRIQFSF